MVDPRRIGDEDDPWLFGVAAFDELQSNQKLAMLAATGGALLCRETPSPTLTAVAEATVAAVYRYIREALLFEIEMAANASVTSSPTMWRQLVLTACRETSSDWEQGLPPCDGDDTDEWLLLVDCLSDRILWDADYELVDLVVDAEPELSRTIKERLTIADDYFVAIPPDPTEQELAEVRQTLHQLLDSHRETQER